MLLLTSKGCHTIKYIVVNKKNLHVCPYSTVKQNTNIGSFFKATKFGGFMKKTVLIIEINVLLESIPDKKDGFGIGKLIRHMAILNIVAKSGSLLSSNLFL